MKNISLAAASLFLFGLSVLFWLLLTLFESRLLGVSTQVERLVTFLLLVVPAAIGVLAAVLSLRRKEARAGMAGVGIFLNALFGLFQLMVILFAG
jgi:hypothetical protein